MKAYRWMIAWAAIILLVILGLVNGTIPGAPHPAEKNVSMYYSPHADALGVSLFVQPPQVTQVLGTTQLVPLQFANHEKTPAHVHAPALKPAGCFGFGPSVAPGQRAAPSDFVLQPGQTAAFLYELTTYRDETCRGQHPLIVEYSWWAEPDATAKTARGAMPAPVPQQAVLTSSAVDVVASNTRAWELFFHIASLVAAAILLPLLLWSLNSLYQSAQAKQDIWKAIFPGLLILTQQHYLPILRRMYFLSSSLEELTPARSGAAARDCNLFVDRLILLRAQTQHLQRTYGGYHFRSKPGEDLYGALEDTFWFSQIFDSGSEPYRALSSLLEAVFPQDGPLRDSVDLNGRGAWKAVGDRRILLQHVEGIANDATKLKTLLTLISMLQTVLTFECDRPLYPEWYKEPPGFPYRKFEEQGRSLTEGFGVTPGEQKTLKALIAAYLKAMPRIYRKPK